MFYVDLSSWCSRWRHLLLLCLTNLSVFFLVHGVSVTEKQLFCVQLRVLNLYGVYWGHFSCLVAWYIHIFSECAVMFSQLIPHFGRIWRSPGRFSVSAFVPFSVLAILGGRREFWNYLCSGMYKISNHPLVSLMVSASQRLLGRPKAKKDPATPELMLKARVESKITDKSLSISDLRSVAWCLTG